MSLRGEIETISIISIFQLLYNDRKTGTMRIWRGDTEVSVIIRNGSIAYATSSKKEARLGSLMLDKGTITIEQLEKCLAIGKQKRQALGKVLVDQKFITLEELEKFIRTQVEEILLSVLPWPNGNYEYKDTHLNLDGMVLTQLDIMSVVLDASRRLDEMEQHQS
ncbi:MAG: DUF4388 domain-containing protein [bacterium]|nr:DUF4388 domain-containing protein [bacterium]